MKVVVKGRVLARARQGTYTSVHRKGHSFVENAVLCIYFLSLSFNIKILIVYHHGSNVVLALELWQYFLSFCVPIGL